MGCDGNSGGQILGLLLSLVSLVMRLEVGQRLGLSPRSSTNQMCGLRRVTPLAHVSNGDRILGCTKSIISFERAINNTVCVCVCVRERERERERERDAEDGTQGLVHARHCSTT
jgi:hypothetical protein